MALQLSVAVTKDHISLIIAGSSIVLFLFAAFFCTFFQQQSQKLSESSLYSYLKFVYACFIKPHRNERNVTGQQAALESFYKAQVFETSKDSV